VARMSCSLDRTRAARTRTFAGEPEHFLHLECPPLGLSGWHSRELGAQPPAPSLQGRRGSHPRRRGAPSSRARDGLTSIRSLTTVARFLRNPRKQSRDGLAPPQVAQANHSGPSSHSVAHTAPDPARSGWPGRKSGTQRHFTGPNLTSNRRIALGHPYTDFSGRQSARDAALVQRGLRRETGTMGEAFALRVTRLAFDSAPTSRSGRFRCCNPNNSDSRHNRGTSPSFPMETSW
jgi:hypothetical protein